MHVVSFVSPSYLGLERHPRVAAAACRAIQRWGMTTATPRALLRDPITRALERRLAWWVRLPDALVFPSSRHAACDTLPVVAGRDGWLLVDRQAYPTSIAGVREAQRHGGRAWFFAHNDVDALARLLQRVPPHARKVIVVDGVYAAGGQDAGSEAAGGHAAPAGACVKLAAEYGAVIYVDDSHGLGIRQPAGRRFGLSHPASIIIAGTLTKALGVPLAFVAGETTLMRRVAAASQSFVHNSPPSIPNLAAACAALAVEAVEGDARRARLAALVRRFRAGARAAGVALTPCLLPIQTVPLRGDGVAVMQRLLDAGVWPALQMHPPDFPHGAVLRFFLTASHTASDIDRAVRALSAALVTDPQDPPRDRLRDRAPRPPAQHATPPGISRTAAAGVS
jgi:7-keto-8-aminopelargonate synthetase-like enzyme